MRSLFGNIIQTTCFSHSVKWEGCRGGRWQFCLSQRDSSIHTSPHTQGSTRHPRWRHKFGSYLPHPSVEGSRRPCQCVLRVSCMSLISLSGLHHLDPAYLAPDPDRLAPFHLGPRNKLVTHSSAIAPSGRVDSWEGHVSIWVRMRGVSRTCTPGESPRGGRGGGAVSAMPIGS